MSWPRCRGRIRTRPSTTCSRHSSPWSLDVLDGAVVQPRQATARTRHCCSAGPTTRPPARPGSNPKAIEADEHRRWLVGPAGLPDGSAVHRDARRGAGRARSGWTATTPAASRSASRSRPRSAARASAASCSPPRSRPVVGTTRSRRPRSSRVSAPGTPTSIALFEGAGFRHASTTDVRRRGLPGLRAGGRSVRSVER